MQQIGVYSRETGRQIMVDFQFEGFDLIRDRIFREFEDRMKLPSFPAAYGHLPARLNFWIMGFMLFLLGLLFWMEYSPLVGGIHKEALGYMAVMFGVLYLFNLWDEGRRIKAFTLSRDEITLYRVFGKLTLPKDEIEQILLETVQYHGNVGYIPKLITRSQETYLFSITLNGDLEMYLAIKKWIDDIPLERT